METENGMKREAVEEVNPNETEGSTTLGLVQLCYSMNYLGSVGILAYLHL